MSVLHVDFETRSAVDLKKTGVYVYAADPSTGVWCMAYRFDDEATQLWKEGEPLPERIRLHILAGDTLIAHNANFERAIWRHVMTARFGWPEPEIEQWRCTMVMALAMSLPGSLENAAAALGLEVRKDQAGYGQMLRMARPRKVHADGSVLWWDQPERKEALYRYCIQDVEVECQLADRLLALRDFEQRLWWLDQKINDRGVGVDLQLCKAALRVVRDTSAKLDLEMANVTDFDVTACTNVSQLTGFVRAHGVETDSLAKGDLDNLLRQELPPAVRRALELRKEAAKASVAKIDALMRGRSSDGRARGLLQYHAASTGRWAGRRFQPQNLKRPELKKGEIEGAIQAVLTGDAETVEMLYGPPLSVVGDTIRGMIVAAPGHRLIAADFNAIEARVLAWLAGQEDILALFRKGADVYCYAATKIYGREITPKDENERQIGKVAVLALGYQGGKGAFATMANAYGVKVSEAQAEEIKSAWRKANNRIVAFWWDLERAAKEAVDHPGKVVRCGMVAFRVAGSFLWLRLPSGRALCYPYPKIKEVPVPWGGTMMAVTYKGVDSYTRKWGECTAYGGLWAENVTQAVARDMMAEAMVRLEDAGYPVVLTVHDEAVCEVPHGHGSAADFKSLMEMVPAWAEDCPIASGVWEGGRYRK